MIAAGEMVQDGMATSVFLTVSDPSTALILTVSRLKPQAVWNNQMPGPHRHFTQAA